MSEKLTIARIKKFGETFEISVDSGKALRYKKGNLSNLREVLLADNIFTDIKKGQIASDDELKKVFQTSDQEKVADYILKNGEIQLTSEHRVQEREQRRKKLINMIHQQASDPKTGLPHPSTRIEAALEQGKIHLNDQKSVEEQFENIISKLRPIIPISIEKKKLKITIPGQFTGKAYQMVKNSGKTLSEAWNNDGSWTVRLEIAAGLQSEFIDKLNSMTHGESLVENLEVTSLK